MRPDGLVGPHLRTGDQGITISEHLALNVSGSFKGIGPCSGHGQCPARTAWSGAPRRGFEGITIMDISVRSAGGRAARSSASASPWWRSRAGPPRWGSPDRLEPERPPGIPAGPVAAPADGDKSAARDGYQFVGLGSHKDRRYNQLFGINNEGRIAGYFGFGDKGHPSQGYTITAPYAQGDIKSENFPHSVQTQVYGLNDKASRSGSSRPRTSPPAPATASAGISTAIP